jgi:hypothetical protein
MNKSELDAVAMAAAGAYSLGMNPMPAIRHRWPNIKFGRQALSPGDYRLDVVVFGRIENFGVVEYPGMISVEIRPIKRADDGSIYGATEFETRGNGGPFPLAK